MALSDLNIGTDLANLGPYRPGPGRSYVVRHWRGDLSLAKSFWLNWILSTLTILILFLCSALVLISHNVLAFGIGMLVAWLSGAIINVWWLVGVWRSAGKHKARGGRRFWAGTARVIVALGFLGLVLQMVPVSPEEPDVPKRKLNVPRGGTELQYIGGISIGATDEVRQILDAHPTIAVIRFNSPGGQVTEAHKLKDLIRERRLATYTSSEYGRKSDTEPRSEWAHRIGR